MGDTNKNTKKEKPAEDLMSIICPRFTLKNTAPCEKYNRSTRLHAEMTCVHFPEREIFNTRARMLWVSAFFI